MRITVQVLNGATGEVRELVANVARSSEQEAVDALFSNARRDDYYYRFMGQRSVLAPAGGTATDYNGMTYWARES